MSFTRKIYDEPAYKHQLYESTQSGKYNLAPHSTYRANDTCFQSTPEIHATTTARSQFRNFVQNDLINAESDLYNLQRKASKDPRTQYPYTKIDHQRIPTLSECGPTDLARSYPLLEAPSFKRSQSIHVPRFESLCLDPQQLNRIQSNHYIGAQTRLWNRDHYVLKQPQGLLYPKKKMAKKSLKKKVVKKTEGFCC